MRAPGRSARPGPPISTNRMWLDGAHCIVQPPAAGRAQQPHLPAVQHAECSQATKRTVGCKTHAHSVGAVKKMHSPAS